MKARIEPFQDGLGEVRYRMTVEEADLAILHLLAAFHADLKKTTPASEPEPWPSDAAAAWVGPPNCDGLNCAELLTERTAGDE